MLRCYRPMARINPFALLRARVGLWVRRPWVLLLFLVADLVELGLSLALVAARQPVESARLGYVAWEAPFRPPPPSSTAATLGLLLGLWLGASLLVELAWVVRLYRIRRYRRRPEVSVLTG